MSELERQLGKGSKNGFVFDAKGLSVLSALTTYPPQFLRTYPPRRLLWRDGLNLSQAS